MRWILLLVIIGITPGFAILAQAEDTDAELEHVVVAGETLTSIGNTYGLTVGDIATSNNIDPNAILRVGQRLRIVFPVAEPTSEPPATAIPTSAPDNRAESLEQVVPQALTNGQSDAPLAMADAPRQDLSPSFPRLCFALFLDANRNAVLDPGEELLPGGELALRDGDESSVYVPANTVDSSCIDGLSRQIYTIAVTAPTDHSLTGSSTLRLDLRNGLPIDLRIGVIPGAIQPAQVAAAPPPTELPQDDAKASQSLLSQISGLFLMALAAIVFVSGLGLALLLRLRWIPPFNRA